MYRLTFLNGRMKGRRIAVREGSVVIGRDPACHLELPGDPDVALRHATIEERDDVIFLCASDASNRLLVNGQPAVEVVLKTGDKIEIGSTQLEFRLISDQEPAGLKRRVGGMQALAFISIGLILIAEFFFVVIAPLITPEPDLSREGIAAARARAAERAAASGTVSRASAITTPTNQQVAHVRRLIDAAARDTNTPAVTEFTAPVPTNLLIAPPVPVAPTGAPVASVVIAPPTNDIPLAPVRPDAPPEPQRNTEAEKMLREAAADTAAGNHSAAERTLDRLQILFPEFAPVYAARGLALEKLGRPKEAVDLWKEAAKRATTAAQTADAQAALTRIARGTPPPEPQPVKPPAQKEPPPLSRIIEIASVHRERFPASSEYDEMRVFTITLKPKSGQAITSSDLRVTVSFYDRDLETGKVAPTRVNIPATTLRVEGAWKPGETKNVTATYSAPKHFRDEELRLHRQRCTFEGYRFRLFYKGELVDEEVSQRGLPEN